MVDLFLDRVLVKNNRDWDQLDTEQELLGRLQNRILLLFFGSAACPSCRGFAPTLAHFFRQLTDESYVERSAQLVLLYVSLDESEEQQDDFLKELPKKSLFLPYEDPYRRELQVMFAVHELPTVVVLRPDCSVLVANAVQEIISLGTDCYRNWREAAELIDRSFAISDDLEQRSYRSLSDPVRRLKYRVESDGERRRRRQREMAKGGGGGGADWEGEEGGGGGGGGGGAGGVTPFG